jgi:F0F1-type ATP synthase assembly protein I
MTERPADDAPQEGTPETPPDGDAFTALSYILAGLLFYGGLGWLGDRFFETSFLLPIGLLLGMGLGTFIIIKRYGTPK